MAEKKINGTIYRFGEITGWEAFDALQLLLQIAGPFVPLLEAVSESDDKKRNEALLRVLPGLLRDHDAGKCKELASLLFAEAKAGSDDVIVGVKPASLDEMLQVFAFCLEVQFSGFFGGKGLESLLLLATDKPKA
jgi:hypothetical protein